MAVEIFKTNIESRTQANKVLQLLKQQAPELSCNFDLDDCDRILRVKAEKICLKQIIQILEENGFDCEYLD
jgi:tRNA G26 N,N-dimethylase Trm1